MDKDIKITWIAVLSQSEAQIYKKSKSMDLIKTMENPLGRERSRGLQTDRDGADRFRINGTIVPHAMSGEKDPHEDGVKQFAREVARYLKAERINESFTDLMVVADPHMTGLLNEAMDSTTKKMVSTQIKKNILTFSPAEITSYLKERLSKESSHGQKF